MAHESINHQNQTYEFADSYPLPDNPEVSKADLRHNIEDQFPGMGRVLDVNLHLMRRSQDGEVTAATLWLRDPRSKSDVAGDWHTIAGEPPLETLAVMGGIYSLSGATIARVDLVDNGHTQLVTRTGSYAGEPVYFQESLYASGFPGTPRAGKTGLTWSVLSEDTARRALRAPTSEQWKTFKKLVGFLPAPGEFDFEITMDNCLEVAKDLAEQQASELAAKDQDEAAARQEHLSLQHQRLDRRQARKGWLGRRIMGLFGKHQAPPN